VNDISEERRNVVSNLEIGRELIILHIRDGAGIPDNPFEGDFHEFISEKVLNAAELCQSRG